MFERIPLMEVGTEFLTTEGFALLSDFHEGDLVMRSFVPVNQNCMLGTLFIHGERRMTIDDLAAKFENREIMPLRFVSATDLANSFN